MKTRSKEYWQERFKELEQARNDFAEKVFYDVSKQYDQIIKTLDYELSMWYQRYAFDNEVSYQEAKKLLNSKELRQFKTDLKTFIAKAEEADLSEDWKKRLNNAYIRMRVSRIEAIQLILQQHLELLFGNQLDTLDTKLKELYTEDYNHTVFNIQQGAGIGSSFIGVDTNKLDTVLSKPWADDGKNFSKRIWEHKSNLVTLLNKEMLQAVIRGDDYQTATNNIARKMNVSRANAGRLIMTESAFIGTKAQQDCFNNLGVEEYEFVATLDKRTSEVCRAMDGKLFKMSDMKIGTNAPPLHPRCRSCTAPYFDDAEDLERVARGENGGAYKVPGDMTYEQWEKAFIDGDKSDLQEVPHDDKIKVKDVVMSGLPSLSKIKNNDDIKQFAEQFIDNLGIDRSNIEINVKEIPDYGRCVFGPKTTQSVIHYKEYVLNANDDRSMIHRIKTVFHESFHLLAEGRNWDGLTHTYKVNESWRTLEETFTESSAHYLLERYGMVEKIAPSYAKELVTNLPRLKALEKYSSCSTIQDFGKLAFLNRKNGGGALWLELSKELEKVKLAENYYTQYYQYIRENEDTLFDMFLGNMPQNAKYRPYMKDDLQSAMNKLGELLSNNETMVYYGIMSCAMQKVGVK